MLFFDLFHKFKDKVYSYNLFKRFSIFLKAILTYLAISGVFGFSCFLMQEGAQMLSFANFSASDTKQYQLMKVNLEYMSEIEDSINFLNKYFLWLIPPQQKSYEHYANSLGLYIKTLEMEVLANAPELYLDQEINMQFQYASYKPGKNNLFVLKNKKIKIITNKIPDGPVLHVQGIAQPDPEVASGIIIVNKL